MVAVLQGMQKERAGTSHLETTHGVRCAVPTRTLQLLKPIICQIAAASKGSLASPPALLTSTSAWGLNGQQCCCMMPPMPPNTTPPTACLNKHHGGQCALLPAVLLSFGGPAASSCMRHTSEPYESLRCEPGPAAWRQALYWPLAACALPLLASQEPQEGTGVNWHGLMVSGRDGTHASTVQHVEQLPRMKRARIHTVCA